MIFLVVANTIIVVVVIVVVTFGNYSNEVTIITTLLTALELAFGYNCVTITTATTSYSQRLWLLAYTNFVTPSIEKGGRDKSTGNQRLTIGYPSVIIGASSY